MFDANSAVLDVLVMSNSTLANLDQLSLEREVPPERKPRVTKVESRDGVTTYSLFYPMAGFPVTARVEETTPAITQAQITAAGGMVAVEAVNLRARTWRTKQGELRLSVKADKITPITAPPSATGK